MGQIYATQSYETQGDMTKTYAVGERAVYTESGVAFRVEVVENKLCNKAIERYSLRINEFVKKDTQVSKSCMQPESEFECQRLRMTGNSGLWALTSKM